MCAMMHNTQLKSRGVESTRAVPRLRMYDIPDEVLRMVIMCIEDRANLKSAAEKQFEFCWPFMNFTQDSSTRGGGGKLIENVNYRIIV